MNAEADVDQLIEQYRLALGEFLKGNPEPVKTLFSHREDASLLTPLAPSRVDGVRSLSPLMRLITEG